MSGNNADRGIEYVDPDPIAIVTICFAGIAMVSGVANSVVQLLENRRRGRDENRKTLERLSEVLIARDLVANTGRHLWESIEAFRRDARVALSFDPRLVPTQARFAIGANGVVVGGASREMWDLLVDDVCNNVKLINRFVLEYTDS